MDLPKLQALVAPLATPVAPALLLGNEMYQVMVLSDIWWLLALVSATAAIVGLEFTGALASYMAVRAWGRRDWGMMTAAIAGALLYAVIVMGGIAVMPEQRARVFAVMVLASLVAYVGYGLYHSYAERDAAQAQVGALEIERLESRRRLINAETRQIKASSGVQLTLDGQTGQVDSVQPAAVTPIGRKIMAYLDARPQASLREVSGEVGCSPETVRTWKKQWEASKRPADETIVD